MSEIKANKIRPRKGGTQTIGDSGDSVTISSGTTTTNAGTISTAGITGGTINSTTGTISGVSGTVEWDTTAKTAAFTAEAGKGYFVDTSSAAITVTFPASPSAGDLISIKDYALTADTNNITIDSNSNKIQGSSADFLINTEGTAANFFYIDSTQGWLLIDASKANDITGPEYIVASGGTETTCGDFKIHTFTSPGTFTVCSVGNPFGSTTVDYLVVAGGGSGGARPGNDQPAGGGAGGFRYSASTYTSPSCAPGHPLRSPTGLPVSATSYPITVGGGGAAVTGSQLAGNTGSNSIFSTITSAGGGKGGKPGGCTGTPNAGGSGGSGGGSGGGSNFSPRAIPAPAGNTPPVSPPQGNPGGVYPGTPNVQASGAGGALTAGGSAPSSPSCSATSGSGAGVPSAFGTSGESSGGFYHFAGGGGVGGTTSANPASPGGIGGGGDGSGGNGTANTGGGGGGSNGATSNPTSGAGGSGIVIIRYKYQ